MKKLYLSLAIVSLFSSSVYAQSSVTLYGIIDAGVVYVNNSGGQKLYGTSDGNLQGSRWGFRGSEDLGGGAKAIFVLENGFNPFTGKFRQGGDEFGRQAYVGLGSQYGAITLGRQYDSVIDFTSSFEVGSQWAGSYAAHPGDLDNMNASNRTNNAIKYTSPVYKGIKFGALYSLGGVAGQYNRNQIWSAGVGYARGPLTLGAAYLNVKNPNFSAFGDNSTSSTTGPNMSGSEVYSGFASAKTQQVITAAGAYTFGKATFGATYSNIQFKGMGQTNIVGADAGAPKIGNANFNNAEASFKYQFTPDFLAGVAYDYTTSSGASHEKIHQAVTGVDYFLSKRTDLYADVLYQHVSGKNSDGQKATAQITNLSPSSTPSQVLAVVGIRHKF